jgi:hypothetical protein
MLADLLLLACWRSKLKLRSATAAELWICARKRDRRREKTAKYARTHGMDRMPESHRAGRSDQSVVPILKVSALGALLATATPALVITLLSALPTGPRPDLSTRPSVVDLVRTVVFLCAITAFPCGAFGFLAGAAGSTWLRFRKQRIRSLKRLLVEAAVAGFLLGALFPFFDSAVNSPPFQKIGVLLTPLQLLLCLVLGIVCALTCTLVFRKHFMEVQISQSSA